MSLKSLNKLVLVLFFAPFCIAQAPCPAAGPGATSGGGPPECGGYNLPIAPVPQPVKQVKPKFPVWGWVALGTDFEARNADVYLTETNKSSPCFIEENLPKYIYGNVGAMLGYSNAIPVGEYFLIRWVNKHHPKVAEALVLLPAADTVYEFSLDVKDAGFSCKRW